LLAAKVPSWLALGGVVVEGFGAMRARITVIAFYAFLTFGLVTLLATVVTLHLQQIWCDTYSNVGCCLLDVGSVASQQYLR
jgi:hypothetical protein